LHIPRKQNNRQGRIVLDEGLKGIVVLLSPYLSIDANILFERVQQKHCGTRIGGTYHGYDNRGMLNIYVILGHFGQFGVSKFGRLNEIDYQNLKRCIYNISKFGYMRWV